jgi:hypothetical protein
MNNNENAGKACTVGANERTALRHSLQALKMLRIFLFGLSNRRKQPERYAKWVLNFNVV